MKRFTSWLSGDSDPTSKWTSLGSLTPSVSIYKTTVKPFLQADIPNYDYQRPIDEDHVSTLRDHLAGIDSPYALFHNFIVAHCPDLEDDESSKWFVLDGQHRIKALREIPDDVQDHISCLIYVFHYPGIKTTQRLQHTFRKINYSKGTTSQERAEQVSRDEVLQQVESLFIKWTGELAPHERKVSYLHRQLHPPSKIQWKLSYARLKTAIETHPRLARKTPEEILYTLKSCNSRRRRQSQVHIDKQKHEDSQHAIQHRHFYIGYDFPACLEEE